MSFDMIKKYVLHKDHAPWFIALALAAALTAGGVALFSSGGGKIQLAKAAGVDCPTELGGPNFSGIYTVSGSVSVPALSGSSNDPIGTYYNCGDVTIPAGVTVTLESNPSTGDFANVRFTTLVVAATAKISADEQGCDSIDSGVGSDAARGPDSGNHCVVGGQGAGQVGVTGINPNVTAQGGAHGGKGGKGATGQSNATQPYDSSISPMLFGASGAPFQIYNGSPAVYFGTVPGGVGGGIVAITAEALTLEGTISANGGAAQQISASAGPSTFSLLVPQYGTQCNPQMDLTTPAYFENYTTCPQYTALHCNDVAITPFTPCNQISVIPGTTWGVLKTKVQACYVPSPPSDCYLPPPSFRSAGGSGGSVKVHVTDTLTIGGAGKFEAKGGNAAISSSTSGTGGSGGRISVSSDNMYVPTASMFDVSAGSTQNVGFSGIAAADKGTAYVATAGADPIVYVFHGFSYEDQAYAADTWNMDASATNQYCMGSMTNGPVINTSGATLSGKLSCPNLPYGKAFTVKKSGNSAGTITLNRFGYTSTPLSYFKIDEKDSLNQTGSRAGVTLVAGSSTADSYGNTFTTINSNIDIKANAFAGPSGFGANLDSFNASGFGCGAVSGVGATDADAECLGNLFNESGHWVAPGSSPVGQGGGGHGGVGGSGSTVGAIGGIAYDVAAALFGSAGGNSGANIDSFARGGGVIKIDVSHDWENSSPILNADGMGGSAYENGEATGGGAGGSINLSIKGNITCAFQLFNMSVVHAKGGNGSQSGMCVGGGGEGCGGGSLLFAASGGGAGGRVNIGVGGSSTAQFFGPGGGCLSMNGQAVAGGNSGGAGATVGSVGVVVSGVAAVPVLTITDQADQELANGDTLVSGNVVKVHVTSTDTSVNQVTSSLLKQGNCTAPACEIMAGTAGAAPADFQSPTLVYDTSNVPKANEYLLTISTVNGFGMTKTVTKTIHVASEITPPTIESLNIIKPQSFTTRSFVTVNPLASDASGIKQIAVKLMSIDVPTDTKEISCTKSPPYLNSDGCIANFESLNANGYSVSVRVVDGSDNVTVTDFGHQFTVGEWVGPSQTASYDTASHQLKIGGTAGSGGMLVQDIKLNGNVLKRCKEYPGNPGDIFPTPEHALDILAVGEQRACDLTLASPTTNTYQLCTRQIDESRTPIFGNLGNYQSYTFGDLIGEERCDNIFVNSTSGGAVGSGSPPVVQNIDPVVENTVTVNGASVIIPANSLNAQAAISVQETINIPPSEYSSWLSPVYELGPAGTTFAIPVTIRIPVIGAGSHPRIYITKTDGSGYEMLTTTVEIVNNVRYAVATTLHFSSVFVAEAAAAVPTVSSVTHAPSPALTSGTVVLSGTGQIAIDGDATMSVYYRLATDPAPGNLLQTCPITGALAGVTYTCDSSAINLPAGQYTTLVRMTDMLAQVGESSESYEMLAPPTAQVALNPASNIFINAPLTVTGTGSDDKSLTNVLVAIDSSSLSYHAEQSCAVSPCDLVIPADTLSPGTDYVATVTVTDIDNLTAVATQNFSVFGPLSVTGSWTNEVATSNVTTSLHGDAGYSLGVSKMEIRLDGTATTAPKKTCTFSPAKTVASCDYGPVALAAGLHTLRVKVYGSDASTLEDIKTFTVDPNMDGLPTAAVLAKTTSGNFSVGDSVTLYATGADDVAVTSLDVFLDDPNPASPSGTPRFSCPKAPLVGKGKTLSCTIAVGKLVAGTHTASARSFDGNSSTSYTMSFNVVNGSPVFVPATKPLLNFPAPTDGNSLIATYKATDDLAVQKLEFYLNDVLKITYPVPPKLYTGTALQYSYTLGKLLSGDYTLRAIAYDAYGSTASEVTSFHVTNLNPIATGSATVVRSKVTTQVDASTPATAFETVSLKGTGVDGRGVMRIEIYLDPQTGNDVNGDPITLAGQTINKFCDYTGTPVYTRTCASSALVRSMGTHTIGVRVRDNEGLWSEEIFNARTFNVTLPASKIINISMVPNTTTTTLKYINLAFPAATIQPGGYSGAVTYDLGPSGLTLNSIVPTGSGACLSNIVQSGQTVTATATNCSSTVYLKGMNLTAPDEPAGSTVAKNWPGVFTLAP